ncbi:DMT family transporter [Bombilactobacillus thymidiniphilus]|uniref:Multidrug efflux SMR transporter n=1 Tax=Bombilactobacillus thymidiniphilus TaxID=2923363 RepID=A0ABY4PBA2_9LACO|nr:multidrug efflux SMR transporter [Bombilactobacillus thymidiniphilus]UQS83029.1 multidrug efflux SMR transporter [Bombilactobacillus thymidiniphilus]
MSYLYLLIAVVGEIFGTSLLKASNGFTNLGASIGALISYGLCFYFLSLSLRTIDLSVAYALWSGLGIVATTGVSYFIWHENLNLLTVLGLLLILIGIVIVNLFGSNH